MQKIVAGILIRPGEILFAQRAPHQTHSGQWEFPGGKVEHGETLQEALIRELQEEIGIQIYTNKGCTFLFDCPINSDAIHLYFYLIEYWKNQPTAQEGQNIGWYNQHWCIKLPLLPTNRALLNRILAAINTHTNLLHK